MTETDIHYIKREIHYTGIDALSPPRNIPKAVSAIKRYTEREIH